MAEALRSSMRGSALRPWVTGAALTLAALLLFWRIGAYPLIDADAAFYGRIARTVLETGELLVLRFDPAQRGSDVDKPPLGIWATAGAFALLGPTESAARFWHALLGVATIGVTARIAWSVAGPGAAVIAAIVLITSAQFFYNAREPLLDIPLTLCVTLTWLLLGGAAGPQTWPRIWAAALVVGLGVLVKGPVAIALTVVPAVRHLIADGLFSRQSVLAFVWRATIALAIVVTVVLPWHLVVYARLGDAFFEAYAGTVSWRSYLKPVNPPGLGLLAYPVFLLASMCPWAGMVVPALRAGCSRRSAPPAVRLLSVAVVWTVVFWGASPGLISAKYLLPALPALAVVIAWWFDAPRPILWRTASWTTVIWGVLLTLSVWLVVRVDPAGLGAVAGVTLGVLAATMVVGGGLHLRLRRAGGLAVLAGGATTAWLLLIALALPHVERMYPERLMAARINAIDGRAARIVVFRPASLEAMLAFYVEAPRLERIDTVAALTSALTSGGAAWVLERDSATLPAGLRNQLDLVSDWGHVRLWRSRAGPRGGSRGASSS